MRLFRPLGTRQSVTWALGLAIVVSMGGQQAASAAPLTNVVSKNAFLFARVANAPQLKAKYAKSSFGKLFDDKAMANSKQFTINGITKLGAMVKKETGLDLLQLFYIADGEINMSVTLNSTDVKLPPVLLLVADVSKHKDDAAKILKTLEDKLVKDKATKSTKDNVTTFALYGKKTKPGQFVSYTISNGILVLSNYEATVQLAADGLTKAPASHFGDNMFLKTFREKTGGEGDVEFLFNFSALWNVVRGQLPAPMLNSLSPFGIDSFQAITASVQFDKGELDHTTDLMLFTNGPSMLLDLVDMPLGPLGPEPWVPATAESYVSFNWDFDKFYKTFDRLISVINPGAMRQVRKALAGPDPRRPFVELERDLVKPLGDRITIFMEPPADKATSGPIFIAWALEDAAAFQTMIKRLKGLIVLESYGFKEKVVKGTKVLTYPLADRLKETTPKNAALPVGTVAMAVTKSNLYLTTHVEILDKVLSGPTAKLSDDKGYQAVAKHFPSKASAVNYSSAKAVGQYWNTLRDAKMDDKVKQIKDKELSSAMSSFANAAKSLPTFDKVSKYFSAVGEYGVKDDGGIHFRVFTLKK